MTGGELRLGAVPARLEERESDITAQAETMREQLAQLTAQLDEPGRAAEEVRITRKTLLGLPDPGPPAPPAPRLPDHPADQQIMAVFTAADHPLRAPGRCARPWTWRSRPTTSTMSASSSSGWPAAGS
ncbi:hypothetical protein [Streptomyces violarus]|uniref:Uncharacterized protein n=1 Tax=Streptomyces violarus TaxID=67380 RepID=A0A7W4ZTI5_9ACTN|nr:MULTISPECIES: hypothetical protein [Streptomyces]MBB3078404.1 hypothetical protein [Streptomyces violarus]WRU02955.1 hypothetical protein VJ737_37045 [Streptomyces sp. CGMCC 4.1772]